MGSYGLFSVPDLVSGAGSIVDLWGHLSNYNISPDPQIADALAIRSDWRAVGNDLLVAKKQVAKDYGQQDESK